MERILTVDSEKLIIGEVSDTIKNLKMYKENQQNIRHSGWGAYGCVCLIEEKGDMDLIEKELSENFEDELDSDDFEGAIYLDDSKNIIVNQIIATDSYTYTFIINKNVAPQFMIDEADEDFEDDGMNYLQICDERKKEYENCKF